MNTDTMGVYGNYYLKRAIVALVGLGANLPEDAVYPLNIGDGEGKPLTGTNKYVLHFAKNEIPPAKAFWSVTLYDKDGFPTANDLKKRHWRSRCSQAQRGWIAGSLLSARVAGSREGVELGEGPITGKTDGVVAYESAHIDGVASEKVVRSGHSTQGHPETIEEVRRILRDHVSER
jgi:hypothetical protein